MKTKDFDTRDFLQTGVEDLLPSVSVDCVIFGFHEGTLKILLNKFKFHGTWMLPGGFVYKKEDVDDAAYRILKSRTGLDKVYLEQFHLFGNHNRTNIQENEKILNQIDMGSEKPEHHWFLNRFVSVGYYAFVEYSKVEVYTADGEDLRWHHIDEIPQLYSDHNKIIEKAILTIRSQIGNIPIGYELLPEKFAMTELRIIYETIFNKKLDRRNFQRKMLSTGLINKLDETSKKWGIKSATLFSFNKEKYEHAKDSENALFD
ncbi:MULTISPECIES: NUDIX hydrolase [unclassified Dysgonomonas]|uniref:NUDIX hydrolase n=1 Tax=unclassified Dysgonomonas TaxID=2630389 RepID=UPI0013ED064D|nr:MULTISPECIES: NUDIX domain-containing protein [unclassified Dysgonomonas]